MSARAISFVIALGPAACSEVIVEPDDAGGGAGGSGSPLTTSSSTAAATSSSTGFDPELKQSFCDAVAMCLPSCTGAFQTFLVPPCDVVGNALVTCLIDHYDAATCSLTGCEVEAEAFSACLAQTTFQNSFGGGCSGSSTDCFSSGEGPDGQHVTTCTREGETAHCACYFNTVLLGTCEAAWEDHSRSCSPTTGCCSSFFGTCPDCPC